MDAVNRAKQAEVDRQILEFVRGMQDSAPVTAESVHRYLENVARRRVTELTVEDRLRYLTEAGFLKRVCEWDGGEVVRWEITADGMDLLDGAIPPRNWERKKG